jgi:hypothetical protein
MKLTSTPANQDAEGVERAFRGSPFGSDTLRSDEICLHESLMEIIDSTHAVAAM